MMQSVRIPSQLEEQAELARNGGHALYDEATEMAIRGQQIANLNGVPVPVPVPAAGTVVTKTTSVTTAPPNSADVDSTYESLKQVATNAVIGALRGGITGAITGGPSGAVTGAITGAITGPMLPGVTVPFSNPNNAIASTVYLPPPKQITTIDVTP
jgi:hypothetical protein